VLAQKDLMTRAVFLARENVIKGKGGPFGAVIAKKGIIIAEASNQVTALNDPTAHAEILAIREACNKLGSLSLDGCEIYASGEPCPMCLGAIYWAKLDRVYFAASRENAENAGFKDAEMYREMCKAAKLRKLPYTLLPDNEAVEALIAWKKAEFKILY
jgi:guanine deaminase